jgi:Ca-activated chloride channel family protein
MRRSEVSLRLGTALPVTGNSLARNTLIMMAAFLFVPFFYARQSPPSQSPLPGAPVTSVQKRDVGYSIKTSVGLVVLHTTVSDGEGRFVPDLKRENFRVFEDKVEQKLSLFSPEDAPVTMGLVIDNSGSMRGKRAQVNAAAMTFVRMSNPQDEAFVVNFNDKFYLDLKTDFTNDTRELYQALSRIEAREGTALYDAILASLDHIKKGHEDKKVLLVITDGDDDASRKSFAYTVQTAQESDATIYAIGVFSEDDRQNDRKMVRLSKKALTTLAEATGGVAYFPDNLDQVEEICTKLAREIRDQYTLGYYPINTARNGRFRTVRVQVQPPKGKGRLTARTRTGYFAPKSARVE